jgi:hypothetical protein
MPIDIKELNFLRLLIKKPFSYIKKTTIKEARLEKLFRFANSYTSYVTGISLPKSYSLIRSLILKNTYYAISQ